MNYPEHEKNNSQQRSRELFTTLPKAARFKKSILVVALLLGVGILLVIMTYLSSPNNKIYEDSLECETHWLNSQHHSAGVLNNTPRSNVQDESTLVKAPLQESNQLTLSPEKEQQLKEALAKLEQGRKSSEISQLENEVQNNPIEVAHNAPIQVQCIPTHPNNLDNPVNPEQVHIHSESSYILKTGTLIPLMLLTELNSELPGYAQAQVSRDMYEARSNKTIVIPQGTKVLLQYDSVNQAQGRLALRAIALIFSNKKTLPLEGVPVVDTEGAIGLHDQVNYHHLSNFLGSVCDVSTPIASQVASSLAPSHSNLNLILPPLPIRDGMQHKVPTFYIRKGFQFNLLLVHDLEIAYE